ncbi:MAG TPA: hypothetical protein H9708_06880 [Candidatus Borkfalkia stercoripullorum]|nr:hypothetical protein [Candidatus Borkfalkia stercoripullorum]
MLKKCISALFVLILCLALLIVPQLLGEGLLFDAGEVYIFYSGSASSGAQVTLSDGENAAKTKFLLKNVTGESTSYGDRAAAFAQAEKYGAELVFTESAGGVTNYYYYTPRLGGAVLLGCKEVNLHVAVRGRGAAVGSPLIFGGY